MKHCAMYKMSLGLLLLVMLILVAGCSGSDLTEAEYLQRAEKSIADNDLKAAVIDLKNVLQMNGGNISGRIMLAKIALRLGNAEDAEKELLRAKDSGAPESDILLDYARSLLLLNRMKEVVELDATAVESGQRANLLGLQAQAHIILGEREQAEKSLAESESLDSGAAEGMLAKALLSYSGGHQAETLAILQDACKRHPELKKGWLQIGELQLSNGNFQDAVEAFKQIIKLEPKGLVTKDGYIARIGSIKAYVGLGEYEGASEVIDYLVKNKIKTPDVQYFTALIQYQNKDYDHADQVLQKLLAKAPDHKPAILLIGAVKYAQGLYEQADMHLTRYLSYDPGHLPARKLLGSTQMKQNMPEQAYETLSSGLAENNQDEQLLAMVGTAALRKGDYSRGREILQKVVKQNPEYSSLKTELALATLSQGEYDTAIQELESIVEQDGDFRAMQLLALAHIKNNHHDQAVKVVSDYVEKHPKNVAGYLLLATVYQEVKDFKKARNVLNQALQVEQNETVLLKLAVIEIADQKIDTAKQYLKKVLAMNPSSVRAHIGFAQIAAIEGNEALSVKHLEDAEKADKSAVLPRVLLARYYLKNKNLDKAWEIVEYLYSLQPTSREIKLLVAATRVERKEFQEAVELLKSLIEEKADPVMYYYLADAYVRWGKAFDAKQALQKSLELSPDYQPAIALYGKILVAEGDHTKAMSLAKQLVKLSPNVPIGYELMGDAYTHKEDFANALKSYDKAWDLAASSQLLIKRYSASKVLSNGKVGIDNLQAWLNKYPEDTRVRYMLAQAYQEKGQNGKAIEAYKDIVKYDGENVIAMNNTAWMLFEQGQLSEAAQYAKRASELAGEVANVQDTYGWILNAQGDYEGAEKVLFLAVKLAPDDLEIGYHYAVVLAKQGKRIQAKSKLEQILDLGKSFPSKGEAESLNSQL